METNFENHVNKETEKMKLLMGAILILSVAAIFTGAIVSFAQILTEVFSVNFSPMGLIP